VKRLMLVCVLLGIGCHEEPPIVIKFEPADMAGAKPASAAATVADAGGAVAKMADAGAAVKAPMVPPGPPTVKKGAPECKTAADCEVVPVECCSCANGGKQQAVTHKAAAALNKDRPKRCKDIMCTMMVSTDPTCGKRADCVAGQCTMK
jgi:hypothetical protein